MPFKGALTHKMPYPVLTVSPTIAAIINRTSNHTRFRLPSAAKVPAANSRESPGKKGVTTNPVSQKIIINSRA